MVLDSLLHPINDITTNPALPVQYIQATDKVTLEELNEYKSGEQQIKQYGNKVAPLPFSKAYDPVQVFQLVQQHCNELKYQPVAIDEKGMRVQCIDKTMVGFKDDIVIELRPGTTESYVEMRSKSRVGKSDMGKNAKRIQEFLGTLRLPTAQVTVS